LSPEDDEALTSALRATDAAAHVQTLTIPVLGTPQTPKSVPQSVLSRLLGDQPRPASPDSCDPKLFADQITDYLEQVAKERPLSGNGNGQAIPNPGIRKPKAAAPPPPPQPPPVRHDSKSGVKRAIPLPAPQTPPAAPRPVAPASDADPLESALAKVSFDASSSKTTAGSGASTDESEALAMGLTSLMERLNAEEREEATRPSPAPKAAPVAPVTSPAPTPARAVSEPAKPIAQPMAAQTAKVVASAATAVEPPSWKELKELESLEYAMPKNVLPRDEEKVEPAPQASAPPAAAPQAAAAPPAPAPSAPAPQAAPSAAPPKSSTSEWGDLMDSLKKDLGR